MSSGAVFRIPFYCVAVLSFLSVTFFPLHPLYIFILLSSFYVLITLKVNKSAVIYLSFILAPFFIAFSSLLFVNFFPDNRFFLSENQWFGRTFNILLLSAFFLSAEKVFSYEMSRGSYRVFENEGSLSLFIKMYMLGCGILLLSAYWHIIDIYTGLINFPVETRSYVHSAGIHAEDLSGRATGFAQEPSYLVTSLVDLIGLSILVYGFKKKAYLICFFSVVAIFFSLSPSGYICLFVSMASSTLFLMIKKDVGKKWLLCPVVVFVIVAIYVFSSSEFNGEIFQYIYHRISTYDPESSGRAYVNIYPLIWLMDSNIYNIFFGFGVKGFSIIGDYYFSPSGDGFNITSNNYFVDTFWESGLLGGAGAIFFFIYLFLRVFLAKGVSARMHFCSMYILTDIFVSCFFRADFASVRFYFILLVLFFLIKKPFLFENLDSPASSSSNKISGHHCSRV